MSHLTLHPDRVESTPHKVLPDAVTTLLSYRTQSWSISMPISGLY